MIKLLDLLIEKKGDSYEYGCVMLYFDFPLMNKIHDGIDSKDLYEEEDDRTYGLEDEPHVTLLFGLHNDVSLDDIKKILDKFTFSTCKIYNASLFKNEKYDVLKFDIKGENLHACNKALKQYPYTNKFPDYHPHMTIGYLKPGMGEKYTNMLKEQEFELVPKYAVYSEPDGTKSKIKIKID
jgi:2'-5' RNA ligase